AAMRPRIAAGDSDVARDSGSRLRRSRSGLRPGRRRAVETLLQLLGPVGKLLDFVRSEASAALGLIQDLLDLRRRIRNLPALRPCRSPRRRIDPGKTCAQKGYSHGKGE